MATEAPARRRAVGLAIALVAVLLIGCGRTKTVVETDYVERQVPAELTERVPRPRLPSRPWTQRDAGELIVRLGEALEACNGRLEGIRRWSDAGSAGR